MQPYSFIGAGSYTNPATPVSVDIPLTDRPDWFFLRDISAAAAGGWGGRTGGNYTAIANVSSEWFSTMPQGSFLQTGQSGAVAAAAALYPTKGTAGGFTFIDQANPPTFAGLPATAINNTTFVVSMASTGSIQVGDLVRVINPVAMQQVGGHIFAVTAVTTNVSVTLGYAATAVAAGAAYPGPATSATIRKLSLPRFFPRERSVAHITQAAQAVVYFFQPHDFTVGQVVDFTISSLYGMQELSFLTKESQGAARVVAVTNTATQSSITIDVDTTGFTAFAYPASAINPGSFTPASCYPAGAGLVPGVSPPGTNLLAATDNRNQFVMNLGLSVVGAANSTIQWMAYKADYVNLSNL